MPMCVFSLCRFGWNCQKRKTEYPNLGKTSAMISRTLEWSMFQYQDVQYEGIDRATGRVITSSNRVISAFISLCLITEGTLFCEDEE